MLFALYDVVKPPRELLIGFVHTPCIRLSGTVLKLK